MIARAVRFAQASSSTTSIALLIGFNLVPLAGVLCGGWNIWTLLVLYWVENGIVGLLNIPKMLLAAGEDPPTRTVAVGGVGPLTVPRSESGSKLALVPFFLVHYGIFWVGHGVFIFLLPTILGGFGSGPSPFDGSGTTYLPAAGQTLPPGLIDALGGYGGGVIDTLPRARGADMTAVAWGAIGLAISHVGSFLVNYVGRREYLTTTPIRQMFAPYGRVVILHLTILFGVFLSLALGSPVGAVVVLVLVKTEVDLALHLREHGRLGPSPIVA